MKKIVILDLDNTLYDSKTFRNDLFKKIGIVFGERKKISFLCQKIYDSLVSAFGFFDPEMFLDKLFSIRDGKREEMKRLIFDKKNISRYFYKDVLSSLPLLSKVGRIAIFSQGEKKLQKAKLENLRNFFSSNKIFITPNKKLEMGKVFQKYRNYSIFFVDDMLTNLSHAKKLHSRVVTIWMKRGGYAKSHKESGHFKPDAKVKSLYDVVRIVKNA